MPVTSGVLQEHTLFVEHAVLLLLYKEYLFVAAHVRVGALLRHLLDGFEVLQLLLVLIFVRLLVGLLIGCLASRAQGLLGRRVRDGAGHHIQLIYRVALFVLEIRLRFFDL